MADLVQVSLLDICNAIKTTLGAAAVLKRVQIPTELSETIPDTPLLQVYPDSDTQDINSNTDRTTFRGGVRQTEIVVFVDFYAHVRASLAEDFGVLITGWDQLKSILEAQDTKPYFGLVGLKAFRYSIKRQIFQYGATAVTNYMGLRITLTLRFF